MGQRLLQFGFTFLAFFDLGAVAPTHVLAQQQPEATLPTIAEIEQAWQDRADKVKTLYCSWTSVIEVPSHSHMAQDPKTLKLSPAPDEDVTFESQKSFYLGLDDKYRYEEDGKRLVNELHGYAPSKFVAVTDRVHPSRAYYEGDRTGEYRYAPLGFISNNQEVFQLNDLANGGPIYFYCRPDAEPVRSYCDLSEARVVKRIEIDGRVQILVEHGEQPRNTQLYLDLEQDFVPTKIVRMSESPITGEPFELLRIVMKYREGPTEPEIVSWKSSSSRSEQVPVYSESAQVTEFVVNPKIDDGKFLFEFPAGTKVIDHSGDKTDVYILRDDGSKRPVTRFERDALTPYKTLLTTEPRGFGGHGNARNSMLRYLIAVNILAIVLAVGLYLYFSRKKSRTES